MVDGDVRQESGRQRSPASEPPTICSSTPGVTDVLRWELSCRSHPRRRQPSAIPSDEPGPVGSTGEGEASSEHAVKNANGSTGGRRRARPNRQCRRKEDARRLAHGTRFTLRHTVAGRDWIPKAAAGWHLCLIVAERLLERSARSIPSAAETRSTTAGPDLNEAYAARLGIPATGLPDALRLTDRRAPHPSRSRLRTAPDGRPEQQSDGPVAERHQRHRTCAGGELAARAGVAGHPRRRDSVIGRHRHGSHAQVPAFPPPSSAGPRRHLPSTILGKVHGTCSFYGRGITDRRGRRGAKEEPPCIRKQ